MSTPNTLTRSTHALTIQSGSGITVGLIQSFNPGMARQITPIYEINQATTGAPVENVPGNVTGLTISVSRYDLYTTRMEIAFGTPDVTMLSDHTNPFIVRELWKAPDGTITSFLYTGCWFSNLGRSFSATDARLVLVNASMSYVRKVPG